MGVDVEVFTQTSKMGEPKQNDLKNFGDFDLK